MKSTLQDKTVLVVGRGSGIARAVTLAAREAGARVVVAGRDEESLAKAYNDPGITPERVDLTDERSIAALAERLGEVDHVVSTASARARGTIDALSPEILRLSFETKAIGPIILAKHFRNRIREGGSLTLFSGSSAIKPVPGMLAVAATNGAADTIARALAVELAPVRVNAISPGTVDTGAYDALGDAKKAALFAARKEHNPARRLGTAEDIADAVVFAMTNTFLTGVSLAVDGGEPLV
ncbi:SDR family oxidoreductase [Streptomyces liangshanensis]|uniref:SDR family oxidoreductase n=1 Tax=Streptomyces liangshanensis TaxID=2717324 RepID=A0A6G9H8A2_9ACTN|nr:SDR family oxidoreductase [Streptomyces liangshanensis]QIQ06441.1 SDR family oxidoreductase [Streptomyces liangshanensis]